ncbi:MAG: diaminopimelate epimerase [Catonella sp.]|uniref:diaminopimelate epimerase n=1 Tax=Catonella sp. TaxID=2382125 RepID=UPI003F9EF344
MNFTKMHGCKNDYLYIDCTKHELINPAEISVKLSDRHTGIGSDGIILICSSQVADFRMRIFNADGSEAEMCGNGIRCVGKFVYDFGLTDKEEVSIETGVRSAEEETKGIIPENRIKVLQLKVENKEVTAATVDMGRPILTPNEIPVVSAKDEFINEPVNIEGKDWYFTCVSMGNPHAVTFVDDTKSLDLPAIGPKFEFNEIFPNRTNTEFIKVISRTELEMRVWERGSGETLACGTGACASAYAAILNNLAEDEVTVHLLGGDLIIKYDRPSEHIFMTGPCETVFSGSVVV